MTNNEIIFETVRNTFTPAQLAELVQATYTAEEIAARPEQKYFYLGISGVHPDDGPFVLQTIREQYGTTDAYLEAEYGLTPARLMRLRRMYLE